MTDDAPLAGQTIAVTAERRGEEQADLFRRRGAHVRHVPTMHTVDLTTDATLRRHTDAVIADPPDWTIATTGFGMRLWFEAADAWGCGDALIDALGRTRVVARGPKARSACRQRDLEVEWQAPDESMDEVVDWFRQRDDLADARMLVQLFDPDDHPSTEALRALAAEVAEIPVYRWRLPDDIASVDRLVDEIIAGEVDAVTFTSQPAVRFLFEIAERRGRRDALVQALESDVLPVCIGPVCAEPLQAAGVFRTVWPEPFRLVPMVKLATAELSD